MYKKLFFLIERFKFKLYSFQSFYYSHLFDGCGENLTFWGSCNIKNPQNIKVGNNLSINDNAYINALGGVVIGNDVSISAGSMIISTMLDPESFLTKKNHCNKKIIIGNNVQIGAGSIILGGVILGDNIIIGAGSIVTKSVKSNRIITGNPGKVLRELL